MTREIASFFYCLIALYNKNQPPVLEKIQKEDSFVTEDVESYVECIANGAYYKFY